MAFDAFLKLDGIDGDSSTKGFEKWIQIESFSFGVSQAGATGGHGGAAAGKASFQDLSLVAQQSRATVPLYVRTATGELSRSAELSLVNLASEKQRAYYTIKLTNVSITSFNEGGSAGGGDAVDQFSLAYDKIELSYSPQNADGAFGAAINGGYDLKANKKV